MEHQHRNSISWSPAETHKLIELFKNHPLLYSESHPDYNDLKKRREALSAVLAELQVHKPEVTRANVAHRLSLLIEMTFNEFHKVVEHKRRSEFYQSNSWIFSAMSFVIKDRLDSRKIQVSLSDITAQEQNNEELNSEHNKI